MESKSEISFRQIHKPTGKRVHYEKIVQGVGRIDSADIARGYEVDSDTYVIPEPEEIDALRPESRKTIDLVQFVDARDVDYRFFERPYFVAPADTLAKTVWRTEPSQPSVHLYPRRLPELLHRKVKCL